MQLRNTRSPDIVTTEWRPEVPGEVGPASPFAAEGSFLATICGFLTYKP